MFDWLKPKPKQPSLDELPERVASAIAEFLEEEGIATISDDRLLVVIKTDYRVAIQDRRYVNNALAAVPLHDFYDMLSLAVGDPYRLRFAAYAVATSIFAALFERQPSGVAGHSKASTQETQPVPADATHPNTMFMAELPHGQPDGPKHVQTIGNKTLLYYENPRTIGNVSGGMPQMYKYPQCAVVAESGRPTMIVRIEVSPFATMLCAIIPTGERSNYGPFEPTTRDAFLAKAIEIAGGT